MTERARIAVVGAGLVGRRHVEAIRMSARAELAIIVDPAEAGRAFAEAIGAPWAASLEEMIDAGGVDGAILATPNQAHVEGGLACVAAGLPVLVEKPLASDAESGRRLVEAAAAASVPLAVGHHRRHNPVIVRAKEMIAAGRLGAIATVHGAMWVRKPDDYFDVAWRRRQGGGPVYINLIHDIDLLQHLCGPIAEVSAMESRAIRGFEVEDSAVLALRFASGALGAMTVSDAVVAPWTWEMTARENPAYPATSEDAIRIGGTEASLALPSLTLWSDGGAHSWWAPISATRTPFDFADPLLRQIDQFAAVIRDGAAPLVSGADGLSALVVIEAAKRSASAGAPVRIAAPMQANAGDGR